MIVWDWSPHAPVIVRLQRADCFLDLGKLIARSGTHVAAPCGQHPEEIAPKLKPKRPALSEGWMWTWCDPKLQCSNSLKVDHSTQHARISAYDLLRPPSGVKQRSPAIRKVHSARTMIIKSQCNGVQYWYNDKNTKTSCGSGSVHQMTRTRKSG